MVARPHLRLNAEQLGMLENHFKLVDNDGDGRINDAEVGPRRPRHSASQFRLLFRSLGQTATNKRLDGIVAGIVFGGGTSLNALAEAYKGAPPEGLDFEGFINAFMHNFAQPPSERALREALMLFDKENTGYIETSELVRLLTTRGEKLEQSEVNYLFELLGIPQSTRRIDYVTFAEEIYRMLPILSHGQGSTSPDA
ncbi:calcium-binding protein CML13 [Babesia caballi]|uniref:Calcium-binding protein CML13 n=1 Tax=Babesia caballi TaxID=5871 RepID=A0AAV4LN74_BABCB|nr:calcium-binding protein CML13 [Babesia caballi]